MTTMTILTPDQWRQELGARLRRVRGKRSVFASDASGVGYRIIYRLEAAEKMVVTLSQVYLLCRYYGCSLAQLIDPPRGGDAGHWPSDAPSWPVTDDLVRTRLRELRQQRGLGVRLLAKRADDEAHRGSDVRVVATVHPSWILRIESGEYEKLDLVRLAAICGVLDASPAQLLPEVLQ